MDSTTDSHVDYISKTFADAMRFAVGGTIKCQACHLSTHIFADVAVCLRCCRELSHVGDGADPQVVELPDEPMRKKVLHMAGADSSPSPLHNDSK